MLFIIINSEYIFVKIVNMESEKVTLSDRIANLVNELDLLKISSAEYSR